MFQGRWPTGTAAVIFPEAPSIAETAPSRRFDPLGCAAGRPGGGGGGSGERLVFPPTATAIHAPSREISTPSGDFPTGIRSATSRVARSTTTSEPLGWSLT